MVAAARTRHIKVLNNFGDRIR